MLGSLASVFTIHNLAYQGVFWHYDMPMTGLGWDLFTPAGLEFYGNLNFLKGGLVFSDLLTTVSRTYAREIRTPAFGAGLEGVLEERSHDLHGIVNGIDYDTWNPAKDPAIVAPYSSEDPDGKAACREGLRAQLGLVRGPGPVIGLVTRLVEQKGIDLVLGALPALLAEGCQLVVLGAGDAHLEDELRMAARAHPAQVAVRIGYDGDLARRIYAGADAFLMPSRYEPCGLGQLIALRYGTVPIVHNTGGLADTVQLWDPTDRSGTGIVFDHHTADGVRWAIEAALSTYRDAAGWRALVANGMAKNFSWDVQGKLYEELYRRLAVMR